MQDLRLFLINESKAVIEEYEVRKNTIKVGMQVEQHHLTEVAVIQVGQHVEQQPMDFLYNRLERNWEVVFKFCRED